MADEVADNIQLEQKSNLKNEDSLRGLWDNNRCNNIHIIGISEDRKQGIENLFEEIITVNFPNLRKEKDIQVLEIQRVPNKMNP